MNRRSKAKAEYYSNHPEEWLKHKEIQKEKRNRRYKNLRSLSKKVDRVFSNVNNLLTTMMVKYTGKKTRGTVHYVTDKGEVYNTKYYWYLKPSTTSAGYTKVSIGNTRIYVHRLVAAAFVPNPERYSLVHHIDGCRKNNSADNLQWLSYKEHSAIHRKKKHKD